MPETISSKHEELRVSAPPALETTAHPLPGATTALASGLGNAAFSASIAQVPVQRHGTRKTCKCGGTGDSCTCGGHAEHDVDAAPVSAGGRVADRISRTADLWSSWGSAEAEQPAGQAGVDALLGPSPWPGGASGAGAGAGWTSGGTAGGDAPSPDLVGDEASDEAAEGECTKNARAKRLDCINGAKEFGCAYLKQQFPSLPWFADVACKIAANSGCQKIFEQELARCARAKKGIKSKADQLKPPTPMVPDP